MILSGVFGMLSGYLGALISYVFSGWSSGPTMVLCASAFFVLAVFFSPSRGLFVDLVRRTRRRRRHADALLMELGERLAEDDELSLERLAEQARLSPARLERRIDRLRARGVWVLETPWRRP